MKNKYILKNISPKNNIYMNFRIKLKIKILETFWKNQHHFSVNIYMF